MTTTVSKSFRTMGDLTSATAKAIGDSVQSVREMEANAKAFRRNTAIMAASLGLLGGAAAHMLMHALGLCAGF